MIIKFLILLLCICFENNARIIVGTLDGNIYNLNEKTGEVVWAFDTGGPIVSSDGKNSVISALDGSIYILDKLGKVEVCK
jgi:outer membrane protein assembly factor BamB